MNPKSKYQGVKYDVWAKYKRPWKVQLKVKGKVLSLFRHAEEEPCALVADFCRYVVYGTDLSKWPPRSMRPNFAPYISRDIDYQEVFNKLLRYKTLPEDMLRKHLAEYTQLANKLRPPA